MYKYLNYFRWNGQIEGGLYMNLDDIKKAIISIYSRSTFDMIKIIIKDDKI